MLSTKNLVFKERPVKKLIERYVEPYVVEEVISKNMVKLKLPVSISIYPVVSISKIVKYRELVKGKKVEKPNPVDVNGIEEWEVEKILNKRKVIKYLVH